MPTVQLDPKFKAATRNVNTTPPGPHGARHVHIPSRGAPVPPGMDPSLYALLLYRQRSHDRCLEIASALLEDNPFDQQVWWIKTACLTSKTWIDDTDLEDDGTAGQTGCVSYVDLLLLHYPSSKDGPARRPSPMTAWACPAPGASPGADTSLCAKDNA
eukprot:gene6102-1091_t